MNIEQLQYIIEVAEQGTILKASENLHVSHSAISQAISSLESELRITIFTRSPSGTKCTKDGKKVLKLAYEIMNNIMELKELGQKEESLKGELSITAATIFFSTFLPEVLYTFKKAFPQIQVKIQESGTHEIIKSINNNMFDLGLILGNDEIFQTLGKKIYSQTILQSKLMVCVSKNSSLAYNQVVSPEELLKQPLVIRNEEFSQDFWNNLFTNYGEGNIVFSSNNHDVVKKLIANNIAVGIYTDFWIKNDPLILKGDIIAIPYFENNYKESYLISIISKQKYKSFVLKEFIKCLNNTLVSYTLENRKDPL